jgi:hypothetical protein
MEALRRLRRLHLQRRNGEAERASACSRDRRDAATVDQLNGVWNSKWERSNPFGRRRPRTKAVFAKLYHACNERSTRAPRSSAAFVAGLNWQRQMGPIVPNIADHFADRPDFQ